MAIQITTNTVAVDTAAGDTERMVSRVNEQGAQRIMSMVVNMYSDPSVAVVREYIANAVDATIVAGTGAPVEVTVPTRVDPSFVVTDFGTGMTKAELEEAFLAFAASTKSDSNDVVGGLGVGAKSAWTVCDAFLVNTVKDGKRNIVRASRDLEHEVLVSDAETDAPNGTVVTIPVDMDTADWGAIIRRTAAAHMPGAVKVDGKDVQSIHALSQWIGPVHPNSLDGVDSVVIVSGGTMFGVPRELRDHIQDRLGLYGAVIKLPVGSFEHTPSREHLIPSATTYMALDGAISEFKTAHEKMTAKLSKLAQVSPTKAATMRANALGAAQSSRKLIPLGKLVVVIPTGEVQMPYRRSTDKSPTVWKTTSNVESKLLADAHRDLIEGAVVITNVPAGRHLRGIGRYMDARHGDKRMVIPFYGNQTATTFKVVENLGMEDETEAIGDGFTVSVNSKGVTVVDYADARNDMKALTAQANANRPKRDQRRYTTVIYRDGVRTENRLTLPEVKEYIEDNDDIEFYVTVGHYSRNINRKAVGKHNIILIVTDGYSHNPVYKVFPNAQDAHEVDMRITEEALAKYDDEVVLAASVATSYRQGVFELAEWVYDNATPDDAVYAYVKPMAEAMKASVTRAEEVNAVIELMNRANTLSTGKGRTTASELAAELARAYPLIPGGYRMNFNSLRDHLLDYMKMVPPVVD